MIVKFFKSNRNPIQQAFNYLLNERLENKTAEIIFGDADFAMLLAQQTEGVAYFSGCLSFKETPDKIIPSAQHQIIQEFMSTIIPDEHIRNQTNWTWIRHTDKNRLELNFVFNAQFLQPIGNMKKYNFFCQQHMHTIDAFQDYIDVKFNCASWKEAPTNLQKTKFENSLTKTFSSEMLKLMIEKIILDNEQLKTRADLVVFLKENGFNVSREVKGSISILPENEKKPIRITISVHASLDELRQKFQQSQHVTQNHNHDIDESQLIVLKQQLEKCKQRTYEHDRKRYFKHADSKKSKYSTAIHEQNVSGRSRNVNRNDVKNDRVRISKSIRKNSEQTAQIINRLRATTKRNQQTIDDITRDITRELIHQREHLEYYVKRFNQRTGKAAFNGSGNESRLNLNKTSGYHHYFNQQQSLYQQKSGIIKEQKSIDFKVHRMSQKLNRIAQKITQCLRITLGSDDVPPMANKPVDEMTREEYIHYVLILMAWCLKKAQKSFGQQNQYLQTLSNEWRQYHSQWDALMKRNQDLNQKMNRLKELQQQCKQQLHQCAIHHDLVSEPIEEKRFLSSISKYRSLSEK